jgi:shikimate kinase/3-dehydroquinate synthase
MRNLILSGFMATGKTTIGRLVAQCLGATFVDSDSEIERRMGRSIAELFAGPGGEAAFRQIEAEVVQEVLRGSGKVIALGGGALLDATSRMLAESTGLVITLTCAPDEIARRVGDASDRPLLAMSEDERLIDETARVQKIEALLSQRQWIYGRYLQVDTTGRAPEVVADEVVSLYRVYELGCSQEDAATGHDKSHPYSSAANPVDHPLLVGELRVEAARHTRIVAGDVVNILADGLLPTPNPSPSKGGESRPIVVLITDTHVSRLHGAVVRTALEPTSRQIVDITVPAGEVFKTLETVQRVYRSCYDAGVDRNALVIGLGGGVIGDLAGFVAATYLRGLRLILIPTTLLAQVDAAIGGKVGVDFGMAKNMIGAFYPAEMVVIDPRFLHTLSPTLLSEGLAEMVKIAVIGDADLLAALEDLANAVAIVDRPDLIKRAALDKVKVVQCDPYDRGERALLNFGHTVGHALEAFSEFRLPHGHAVAIGMVVATHISIELGLCAPELLDRLITLLERFGLPTVLPQLDSDLLLRLMAHDKKRTAGELRFVLPLAPGHATIRPVPRDVILASLALSQQR